MNEIGNRVSASTMEHSVSSTNQSSSEFSKASLLQVEDTQAHAESLNQLVEKVFDSECYLATYDDLRGAVARSIDADNRHIVRMCVSADHPGIDPIAHFHEFGMREGRAPSILFDIGYSLYRIARFDDVRLSPGEVMTYFARLPKNRRFVPNSWFSPWAFRRLYADRYEGLETLSDYEVFEFYLDRNSYAALSPCGTFNEENYRLTYRDVASAIGRAQFRSGFFHFVMHGGQDGRTNLPGVITPELDGPAAEARPAEALWLMAGQTSVAPMVWWFDPAWYLAAYPDVHERVRSGPIKSALEHYLVEGFREARLPSPRLFGQLPSIDDPDPWMHFAALTAPRSGIGKPSLSLDRAAAILRYLDRPGWQGSRRAASEALWPHVVAAPVDGTLSPPEYLALSTDVASRFGDDEAAARRHWRDFGAVERRPAPGSNVFGNRRVTLQDVLSWRSGVNYFGPIRSTSGLGSSARGYEAALRAAGVPVATFDTTWLVDPKAPAEIFASGDLPYSINVFCLNADQIVPFALRYGTAMFQHRANAAIWVWELPSPLPQWRSALAALDLIIAPSQFCKDSFALSTDLPIAVVPHVVEINALQQAAKQAAPNVWLDRVAAAKAVGKRIVLFIMDASSYIARKGLDLFLELAERIERRDPGQYLFVVKSHSQDHSRGPTDSYDGPVLDVRGVFKFADLCALKALADLYVSPHRSEGFGLNIVESILLRVPVLCSDFGGIADILASNDPRLIPVGLREVGRDMGPYRAEAIWAEPDIDALEEGLIQFFESKPSRRFPALRQRLSTEFSTAAVGARMVDELTRWCGYGAERRTDPLEAFRHLACTPRQERFVLGYVTSATRRSLDAPGLDRMDEIFNGALRPVFSVITPTYDSDPQWLEELYDDLLHQSFPSWEWCICDDGSTRAETLATLRSLRQRDSRIKLLTGRRNTGISAATNAGVAISQGRYVLFVDHDDRIASRLLESYRAKLDDGTFEGIVYCDEDKILSSGLLGDTYCKPDWSPEHLLSCMYVLHCLCVRKSVFLALGGYKSEFDGAQDHDFMLRACAAGTPIRHVDEILYHWRISPNSMAGTPDAKVPALETGRRAVRDHMRRIGVPATVEHGLIPGSYRVRPSLPGDCVELNILTGCTMRRDDTGASQSSALPVTFVEQFVRSILRYPPDVDFRIRVVVDSAREAIAAPLAALDPRIQIIPFARPHSSFNFSAMANFAVEGCRADRIVLLNDDMLAEGPGWLSALLEPLELQGVGIVGGHLLYGHDRQQHCGMALGVLGPTAHLFEGEVLTHIGYNAFNRIIRNYSAVTGALMAFRRATFDRVHGFDVAFPVDYNDVDFCLRVGRTGLRVVYTPFAQLRHFESRSALRLAADPMDRERFSKRWAAEIARDPYYNRNLPRDNASCAMDYDGEASQTLSLRRAIA